MSIKSKILAKLNLNVEQKSSECESVNLTITSFCNFCNNYFTKNLRSARVSQIQLDKVNITIEDWMFIVNR